MLARVSRLRAARWVSEVDLNWPARVHDDVAADHRQAGVGAVETDMLGAVRIDDNVAGDEAVVGRRAHCGAVGLEQAQRAADGRVIDIGGRGSAGKGHRYGGGQQFRS